MTATPGRTIRSLLSRLSAGEALTRDELREAGLDAAIETIMDDWASRGLLARAAGPGRPPRYVFTPHGASTARWD
jgi:hypothetical protein